MTEVRKFKSEMEDVETITMLARADDDKVFHRVWVHTLLNCSSQGD